MKLDDKNAYAHYYAGYAYLRSGNPSKSVEAFKSFLQLAPAAPEAAKVKALVDALC
jgi:regulator of sirC expression with transglutaminase-like and TPR domain